MKTAYKRGIAIFVIVIIIGGVALSIFNEDKMTLSGAEIHPNGEEIFYFSESLLGSEIKIYNIAEETITDEIKTQIDLLDDISISPSGQFVAVVGTAGPDQSSATLEVFDTDTGDQLMIKEYSYPEGKETAASYTSEQDLIQWSATSESVAVKMFDRQNIGQVSDHPVERVLVISTGNWSIIHEFDREMVWGSGGMVFSQDGSYLWHMTGRGSEFIDLTGEIPAEVRRIDSEILSGIDEGESKIFPKWANQSHTLYLVETENQYNSTIFLYAFEISSHNSTQIMEIQENEPLSYFLINPDGDQYIWYDSYNSQPIIGIPSGEEQGVIVHPYRDVSGAYIESEVPRSLRHIWSGQYLMYSTLDHAEDDDIVLEILNPSTMEIIFSTKI